MPFADTSRGKFFWRQDGASARPALVLLHPALSDHSVWDRMVPFLTDHFRVIRIDLPGHGATPHKVQGGGIADLAFDVLSVMDSIGIANALCCGVSIGGLIGLSMGAAAPDRISGVVASLRCEDFDTALHAGRGQSEAGAAELVDTYFEAFATGECDKLAMWLDPLRQAMLSTTPEGYRELASAHSSADLAQLVKDCPAPGVLLLSGDTDRGPNWPDHAGISTMRWDAGLVPPIEAPGALATVVARLHDRIQPDGVGLDPARNGERVRREVLGDMWVDRSLAARDSWISDYQDYATQVAWHTIWSRKGLDYRTRRLLVLALTAALGRWEEFRFHVRLGIERGSLTVQDVKEVSLQTGLYAGVPVSNTAFNEARSIFADLGITFAGA